MANNTKLWMAPGTAKGDDPHGTAPTGNPSGKQTDWVRGKKPAADFAETDRNPTHWTMLADNWFCWGGLTKVDGKYYVQLGPGSDEEFTIDPQQGNGLTTFSIAGTGDVLCLEYNDIGAGTPASSKYTVAQVGSSDKYKVTETTPHSDTTGQYDHFYVFASVGSDVCLCDPMIRND